MKSGLPPEIKLSPRLQAIADLIPQGASLADIGTDHAHIPIYLMQNGRAAHAIASDIHRGPIARARANIECYGLSHQVETRFGAGLEPVGASECDSVIIAGMSGQTIADILQAASWTAAGRHILYLQPMTGAPALRQYLMENGYAIRSECVVQEDRRYYIILTAQGSPESVPEKKDGAAYYKPVNLEYSSQAGVYLNKLLAREQSNFAHMQSAAAPDMGALQKQQAIIKEIETALEEYHAGCSEYT